jgi:hypothetical protein
MKRFPILGIILLIPALAMLASVGCDKSKDSAPPPPTKDTQGSSKDAKDKGGDGDKKDLAAPGENPSSVSGMVKFKGEFTAVIEPELKKHKEAELCMGGKEADKIVQTWIVGKDHGLANVVISLEPPANKKYKVDDKLRDSFKDKKAVLDQPFCAYHPHVLAIYAKVQPLVVTNSSKALNHNTNIKFGPKNIPSVNKPIAKGESWAPLFPDYERNPIPISCEMHGFMSARLVTFNHPYFAVTDENGAFKIDNVPSGEELTIYAWHESMSEKKEIGKKSFKKGTDTIDTYDLSK